MALAAVVASASAGLVPILNDDSTYVWSTATTDSAHSANVGDVLMFLYNQYHDVQKMAALAVDEDELEDARWFSKEYVREQLGLEREAGRDGPAVEGGFHVPSRVSLARTLIESWLAE